MTTGPEDDEKLDSDLLATTLQLVSVVLKPIRALMFAVFLLAGIALFLFVVWLEQISPSDAAAVKSAFLSSTAGKWAIGFYSAFGLTLFGLAKYLWRAWRFTFRWTAAYLLAQKRRQQRH